MSITTKEISPTLSNLISEANYSLQSAKDKILKVYYYAVDKDGYTPLEARQLVEKEIVNVSKRYIRGILPDEAKDTKSRNLYINHDAEHVPRNSLNTSNENDEEKEGKIILPDGKLADIPDENKNNLELVGAENGDLIIQKSPQEITDEWYNQQIKELKEQNGPVTYHDGENSVTTNVIQNSELDELKQINKSLKKQVQELEQKVNENTFEQINKTKGDIVKGTEQVPIKGDAILAIDYQFSMSLRKMIKMEVNEKQSKVLNSRR